ncbi:MAG TPA: Crp/Fnr family transcriptional regulator [Candidatus Sulfotelmatobacter sp.]|jgi:CRP-like cAMP-binding protein|nr:Crp/Fnr family transcriptional regulator [Candidatus Sulfotelmatobacter sp.]
MAKSRAVSIQSIPPPNTDGDGKEIGNLILLTLPRKECTQIFPSLEFVRLNLHHVMHEAGEVIKSVYFLNNGMASVLTVLPDGKSVEVGLIGKEGFVGLPVVFGFKTSPLRVVVQGDATAYRLDVTTLRRFLPQCRDLEKQIQRFAMVLAMQSTQLAACNRLHDVEERLARWLLMSHDRIGGETMPLTQEFLGQMLGTRRSSVSVAASILQKAGMITYTRGNVTIVDKPKLSEAACDCYQIIQNQKNNWQAETQ